MEKEDPCRPTCEQVIEIIPQPFVIIDREYRIVAANRPYRELYGDGSDSVVGLHCFRVSHHSDEPCSRHGEACPLESVFATHAPLQVMHVHRDRHGQDEYVQIDAAPLLGADGRTRFMGEQMTPVTNKPPDERLLVGRSRPLLHMMSLIHRVASTQTTVLLLGESGTGKECVAEYLHHYSSRSIGPFVVLDCSILGENLIENELFGHEKGAFTGAAGRKLGLFETASGGTLLIDEIGEMPIALQTKLLRVLETGKIRRLGGTAYLQVDVRVIAASNRDLRTMVDRGQFREDLYYRLSAFPVQIPPLRERKDDIPALAEYFLTTVVEEGDRHVPLSPEVIEALLAYDYPGNVRELRNIIERASILACDGPLGVAHLVFERQREGGDPEDDGAERHLARASRFLDGRHGRLSDTEILQSLERHRGHRGHAARELGVSERTLYRHLRRLRAV